MTPAAPVAFGNTVLGSESVRAESEVHLTGSERDILRVLAERLNSIVTYGTICGLLYGSSSGGEPEYSHSCIKVFVCKLRIALRRIGSDAQIGTVWGQGYKLVATPRDANLTLTLTREQYSALTNLLQRAQPHLPRQVEMISGAVERAEILLSSGEAA